MRRLGLELPRGEIAELCRRWNIAEPALFASILRAGFRPDSDVDVVVTFAPEAHWSCWTGSGCSRS
jgi:predicted nucleotidyltransferase